MQFTLPLGERGTTTGTRYSAVILLRAGAIQGVRGDAQEMHRAPLHVYKFNLKNRLILVSTIKFYFFSFIQKVFFYNLRNQFSTL